MVAHGGSRFLNVPEAIHDDRSARTVVVRILPGSNARWESSYERICVCVPNGERQVGVNRSVLPHEVVRPSVLISCEGTGQSATAASGVGDGLPACHRECAVFKLVEHVSNLIHHDAAVRRRTVVGVDEISRQCVGCSSGDLEQYAIQKGSGSIAAEREQAAYEPSVVERACCGDGQNVSGDLNGGDIELLISACR